jgi:hypothetical protein
MCCCEKPNVNGQPGYLWSSRVGRVSIYPVSPPMIEEGEKIIFDEPGRCGGQDSHSFHYRLMSDGALVVRHGGGDERISYLSNSKALIEALTLLDSNSRYWILNAIYHAQSSAARKATAMEAERWHKAAADKRIKTRKLPSSGSVKVWIEEEERKS